MRILLLVVSNSALVLSPLSQSAPRNLVERRLTASYDTC